MTGIGNPILYSYTASKTAVVPKNVKQVIGNFAKSDDNAAAKADVSKMRRVLRSGAKNLAKETNTPVIDNMQLYAKALKKQRMNNNDVALEKKKVKYSFKKISSKIISSKTSTAAREAVSQAKREIQKLKAARRSGKYDPEEIEAALDHAKAMERIARKKVKHLEEEEMARRCSPDGGSATTPAVDDEEIREDKDPVKEEIDELRKEVGKMAGKAENEEYIESADITNEMISEITEGMEEMLDAIEEMNDLMDELAGNVTDMDPEDIKAMIIKHRNKEMKDITKADADYLKAMFEHYESIKAGADTSASTIDVAL